MINTIIVLADGAVVPCYYDLSSNQVMDNIKDLPLANIWNSQKYKNLQHSIMTR
ncbi:SPASM domain-containing protein [Spartinivicinus poritis]|uniref:SPASM domain-containing protein n=1 Tax=Spartinivicinus poritis TaxID=2994640 RepID=UPI003CC91B37